MKRPWVRSAAALLLAGFLSILQACEFPIPLPPAQDELLNDIKYYDEYGCFPIDCDLPAGMRELCMDYQSGIISWPEDCEVMPGQACQQLCIAEKATRGLDRPMTVVDGYAAGWTRPLQLDDHLNSLPRPDYGWAFIDPVVDPEGRVLLIYATPGQEASAYYRYWDGVSLSDAERWNGPLSTQASVFDSQGLLHIVSMEKKGQDDQYLLHSIWDGDDFESQAIFAGNFDHPAIGDYSLAIDTQDHLHLAFLDRSRGVREVWYTNLNGKDWSVPECVSNTLDDSWNPSIAVSKDGRIFISWPEDNPDTLVESATRDALMVVFENGAWSDPIPGVQPWSALMLDSHGQVHTLGENAYSYWDGEKWSEPLEIDYPDSATAFYHFAISPDDTITFVWNRYNQLDQPTPEGYQFEREMMTRRRYADGSWSPVMSLGVWDLVLSYYEVHTNLVADAEGIVHAGTVGSFEGGMRQYYLNTAADVTDETLARLAAMPPQPAYAPYPSGIPVEIESAGAAGWNMVETELFAGRRRLDFDLVIDAQGSLHAVWQAEEAAGNYEIFYSRFDGSQWSDVLNLSQRAEMDADPEIEVDAEDRIYVGWKGAIPGTTAAFVSVFDGQSWSTPERISQEITWEMSSSLIPLVITAENVTRPVIEAGAGGDAVMFWEHVSEGTSNTIAYSLLSGGTWLEEAIPLAELHFPYAGSRSAAGFDLEGNLHLAFEYSGNMEGWDQGAYLKSQLMYTRFDGSAWSAPVNLVVLPSLDAVNPFSAMAFQSSIAVANPPLVYVAFSMRTFEPAYFPYRRMNENSNVYVTVWDGSEWTQPQQLDEGSAFGPSFIDVALDAQQVLHAVWSKYDNSSKHYSIYHTTLSAADQGVVEKIWESETEQNMFPIIKPTISINSQGKTVIGFETKSDHHWRVVIAVHD